MRLTTLARRVPKRRAAGFAMLSALAFATRTLAGTAALDAPNVVVISPQLVTSGQPTAKALGQLGAQGFGAVIYLAPPTVSDAVPGEAQLVRRQGLGFVNIPIKFGTPTDADYQAFMAAMNQFRSRKVLVHCQLNMRASSMTFLYRVIVQHVEPDQAYAAVTRVWVPDGPWKNLLVAELHKAAITFEPY